MNNRWRRQLNLEIKYARYKYPKNSLARYILSPVEKSNIESQFRAINYYNSLLSIKYKHTSSFRK